MSFCVVALLGASIDVGLHLPIFRPTLPTMIIGAESEARPAGGPRSALGLPTDRLAHDAVVESMLTFDEAVWLDRVGAGTGMMGIGRAPGALGTRAPGIPGQTRSRRNHARPK